MGEFGTVSPDCGVSAALAGPFPFRYLVRLGQPSRRRLVLPVILILLVPLIFTLADIFSPIFPLVTIPGSGWRTRGCIAVSSARRQPSRNMTRHRPSAVSLALGIRVDQRNHQAETCNEANLFHMSHPPSF